MIELESYIGKSERDNPVKKHIHKIAVAALLIIACPGDNLAALTAIGSSSNSSHVQMSPEEFLGLYWLSKKVYENDKEFALDQRESK